MIKKLFILYFLLASQCYAGQLWTKSSSTPVLSPTLGFEGTSVGEPRVINFGGNTWVMFYATYSNGIARATSTDGVTWTKGSNVVIGSGQGNESGQVYHLGIYYENSILYIFYVNTSEVLYRQQSTDQGQTWTNRTLILDPAVSPPATVLGYDNVNSIVKNGSTYHMWLEAHVSSSGTYKTFHLTSTDLTNWTFSPSTPLTTLAQATNSSFGSCNVHLINGTYYMWYHGGYSSGSSDPTAIFFASSTDGTTWTPTTTAIFPIANELNVSGLHPPIDQTADISIVESGNITYAYYSRDTNSTYANIALATFNGTLSDLIGQSNTKSMSVNASFINATLQ